MFQVTLVNLQKCLDKISRDMTKPTKWVCAPAKTQISLGIRPVWSESSLSAWRKLGSLATYWAHSEDSDQTGRMPRLTGVFAGRTLILLVLSCRGSFLFHKSEQFRGQRSESVMILFTGLDFKQHYLRRVNWSVLSQSGVQNSQILLFRNYILFLSWLVRVIVQKSCTSLFRVWIKLDATGHMTLIKCK